VSTDTVAPRSLGPGVVRGEVLIFSRLPVPSTNLLPGTWNGLRQASSCAHVLIPAAWHRSPHGTLVFRWGEYQSPTAPLGIWHRGWCRTPGPRDSLPAYVHGMVNPLRLLKSSLALRSAATHDVSLHGVGA
jgi:hypothetical protein